MDSHIATIRSFNRFYTNTLGLFKPRLYTAPLSLAEARALFEICADPGVPAATLAQLLSMDRGQLSRILAKLVKLDMVERRQGPSGRRAVPLRPTAHGLAVMAELNAEANQQAADLLERLNPQQRNRLSASLDEARCILDRRETSAPKVAIRPAGIGDMGWIIQRHAEIYRDEWGFNEEFEGYVLTGLAKYVESRDTSRSRLWIAEYEGRKVGSIGVVETGENRAQLRWFLVEPFARGLGVGKMLFDTALEFCRDAGFQEIFLWTLAQLLPARTMYRNSGFTITESEAGTIGGVSLMEERWALPLTPVRAPSAA